MAEPKLNFNTMPTKGKGSNVEAGMNDLVIVKAIPGLSKAKKQMLVVTVAPVGVPNFTIDDYCTLFGTEAEGFPVEEFGQFKLRTYQEVTKTIPEGDFSIALIGKMLKGKKFRAELITEAYQGKDYLKVGFPESFEAYIDPNPVVVTEPVVTETPTPTETPEVASEIINAIVEDEI